MLKLYNTLSRKKEVFKPLKDKQVGIYTCGPTVYWYQHIGNLRSYVFADILKRVLKLEGYKIKQVMNITDVGHLTSNEDTGEEEIVEESGNEETGPPTSGATERQGELVEEEEPADEELIIEQPKLELNADPTPEGKPLIDEAPVTLPEPISEPEPAIIDEENNNEDE